MILWTSNIRILPWKHKVAICLKNLVYCSWNFKCIKLTILQVKCFKIKSSGSLEVTVGIVDVGIHLAIDFGEQNCKAKLESFQIEQFKKLKVNFINSKLKLFSKLINYIVNSKRQMIVDIITESISALIKSELDKLECDSYKPTDNWKCW